MPATRKKLGPCWREVKRKVSVTSAWHNNFVENAWRNDINAKETQSNNSSEHTKKAKRVLQSFTKKVKLDEDVEECKDEIYKINFIQEALNKADLHSVAPLSPQPT